MSIRGRSIQQAIRESVMTEKHRMTWVVFAAIAAVALAMLGFAGTASAKLTGEYTRFEQCPWTNPEVSRCIYSPTEGGEVVLGSKKVPIVNTAVLQGGVGFPDENNFSKFYAAKNGVTLSKAPQPVPGGLAGLVNCKEISNFFLRVSCEVTFENGLTGLDSTLELAQPASEIRVSETHLAEEIGVALKMPVRVHLENPFLGSSCFVGSSSSPIIWELTSGETAPPGPNKPIKGTGGKLTLIEEGLILRLDNTVLVDNAWSAPGASGCGGIFSFILDPIVNSSAGLPSAAGKNTAILKNKLWEATTFAIKLNNEKNP
jgi:hypothetical protein